MLIVPFFVGGDDTTPPTTAATTTSTTIAAETTIPLLEDPFVPILEAPVDTFIYFDEEFCADWALDWEPDPFALYYFVQVAAMDDMDGRHNELSFESFPPLCMWEFYAEGFDRYWLWITAVGEGDFGQVLSDPAFVEFRIP